MPGEMIGFNAEMDNQSDRQMNGSTLKLVEHVRYMTPRKNKNETRVVAEINRGAIGPGESDMWEGVVMRVPAVPPTNLAGMYRDSPVSAVSISAVSGLVQFVNSTKLCCSPI